MNYRRLPENYCRVWSPRSNSYHIYDISAVRDVYVSLCGHASVVCTDTKTPGAPDCGGCSTVLISHEQQTAAVH
jgi:hypothetical protein